jgi:hypothetical protein
MPTRSFCRLDWSNIQYGTLNQQFSSQVFFRLRFPSDMAMPLAARLIITDMVSPAVGSLAGVELGERMAKLRDLGCPQSWPRQEVSALAIPADLHKGTKVFVAGSPANHDPDNGRFHGQSTADNVRFKQEVFYSMCWNTCDEAAVVVTYSSSACGRMEYWTVPEPRVLIVAPAHFATYRPRKELSSSLEELADDDDTMAAMLLPAGLVRKLAWRGDAVDVAASVARWCADGGSVVTFGAYTVELELDLASVAPENTLTRNQEQAKSNNFRAPDVLFV